MNSLFILKVQGRWELSRKYFEYAFLLLLLSVVLHSLNILVKDSESEHRESMLHLGVVKVNVVRIVIGLVKDRLLYFSIRIVCIKHEGDSQA